MQRRETLSLISQIQVPSKSTDRNGVSMINKSRCGLHKFQQPISEIDSAQAFCIYQESSKILANHKFPQDQLLASQEMCA